jgi:thymidylate kinase
VADALDALEREGIRWSLLRPRASLEAEEGDVDLLVEPDDLGPVESLLAGLGFTLLPTDGPDLHAALYDREAGRFAWLHVQDALRIAGGRIPADDVLAHAVIERAVRRPADDWLLWILLLRALVDKGELAARHRPVVERLAAEWSGGPPQLEALARRHQIDPERAVAAAAAGDWQGVMRQAVHRPPPRRSLAARLLRAPWRLLELWRARDRRGISVAVLGPDGAGKTSLVKALARDLPLPTRVQYMGLTGGKLPKADALRIPGIVFCARVAIMWMRYARGFLTTARGGIVVFDRYNLDGTVPSGMRLSPVARFSRRIQVHVCPLPDLVLVLDAPGETLYRRSGEYDAATLEAWRQGFARLESRYSIVRLLDAVRPAEEVRREAEELVWRRYAELRGRDMRSRR